MQGYIKFAVIAIGLVSSSISGCFLVQNAGETQTPVLLDLAAMERGEAPPSRYVQLESYVIRVDETFVESQTTPKKGGGEVTIRDYYFPTVSPTNPAADPKRPLESFVLVVKPRGNPVIRDGLPEPPHGTLVGALAIGLDAIEGDEIAFLRKEYPAIDVSRIRVLIPGEKPWTGIGGWLWLGFGIVVTAVGLYLLTTADRS